ncbi:GNAT family N-acetyltransferase [Fontibacillus sp. BL9]|uniref:GNAT family N-acetyltransferase n=1 Tax=Fontibacillus sp. BL9 TaxID=3389971 RepID=UPI00397E2CB0
MKQREFVLEGTRLRIRPSRPGADMDFVLELEHHEENRRFISPWLREQHEEFKLEKDHLHLIIENKETKEYVGYMLLEGILLVSGCIDLKRLVIASKGLGYGRETLRLVKDWAFNDAGAHRLQLDVKSINSRAKGLYESEGFVQEGLLRDRFRNESGNGYVSLYIMSILEKEYRHV